MLDSDGDLDVAGAAQIWNDLTNRRGTFSIDGPVKTVKGCSTYVTKGTDWCPAPGTVGLDMLNALHVALKNRRMIVEWGDSQRSSSLRAHRKEVKPPDDRVRQFRVGARRFHLHDSPEEPATQFKLETAAFEGAAGITGSDDRARSLEFISLDFLASNPPGLPKEEILARLEAVLGLKLIALDRRTGMPKRS